MRKFFRRITVLLLAVFILTFSVPSKASQALYVSNSGYGVYIEDDAGLLSEEEKLMLVNDMAPCTRYGNAFFKTTDSDPYGDSEVYAGETYYGNFGNDTGVMLLIDMDNRQITVVSVKGQTRMIQKSKTDAIVDNVYTYATRGDYYGCAKETFREIAAVLDGERISEPMRYISSAVLAVLISMFLCFWICYKRSGLKKTGNADLLAPVEVYFRSGPAHFVNTKTTVQYSPPVEVSSGGGGGHGGGGGGGHSGGGGGFSGGGSSHSF